MNKPLVHVIDDDLVLSKILQHRLENYGCDVEQFSDTSTFYLGIKNRCPQLILVDINLGEGESGFNIINKIRGEYQSQIPIIILSGERDQKSIAHGLELGANDYLLKPCSQTEFQEIISHYLSIDASSLSKKEIFLPIIKEKGKCKIRFRVSLAEVHPLGLTLLSDHLIKKGTVFYLRGEELKLLLAKGEKVLVSVIGSSTKMVNNQKKYLLQLEINPDQTEVIEGIRLFLNSKFSQRTIL